MKAHNGMKSQDIAILLYICVLKDDNLKVMALSRSLGISQSEISESLNRSRIGQLMDPKKKEVFRSGLIEFIKHGLRFVFPAQIGPEVRGVPTSHSAPPLSDEISASSSYVWPCSKGKTRGLSIKPLYPTVPETALVYPKFHELMALTDALRIGRAREAAIAGKLLEQRLLNNAW